MQYTTAGNLFSSNFRFRWEYRPGSELFVVYTDERDTLAAGYPALREPGLRREGQSVDALLAVRA